MKKNYPEIQKFQNPKVRRWTGSAIDCYERGCQCSGCYFETALESIQCRMKLEVIELVRILGKPVYKTPDERLLENSPNLQKILSYMRSKKRVTILGIYEVTGVHKNAITNYLQMINRIFGLKRIPNLDEKGKFQARGFRYFYELIEE